VPGPHLITHHRKCCNGGVAILPLNMEQNEYWSRLEFRLCDEFKGMSDKRFSNLWCDGFIPDVYLIRQKRPMITGRVWIVKVQNQQQWEFKLFLRKRFNSVDEIDWEKYLPPLNVTKWLAVDWDREIIQIEPTAAVPDCD
jgi:hypothetical protein